MMSRGFLLFHILNVLLIKNILCQLQIPIGSGCGCQQNLPVPIYPLANNYGCCRNNLLGSLATGTQLASNLQLAKSPCGCLPNNLQLGNLQNLQLASIGSGLQLANGFQLANVPQSQDLLALLNAMPVSNCQNALQFSMQALLNQLSQQQNCQCGCQPNLAQNIGSGLVNANLNLLGVNSLAKAINNLPCQSCGSLQVVTGQQEIVLNNPCSCQSCQNVVSNPCSCQSCQNVVSNPCSCQSCQNVVSNPCSCQPGQNVVSNPSPCQSCQNVVSNPCACQSCQNPVFTIYQ